MSAAAVQKATAQPFQIPSSQLFFEPADSNGAQLSASLTSPIQRSENAVRRTSIQQQPTRIGHDDSINDRSVTTGTPTSFVTDPISPVHPAATQSRSSSAFGFATNGVEKKMHQTSTRIMKVTPDGRPFATDFNDLFGTLAVSLGLTTHRSRFRSYQHSFTTEEAVMNLSNLKFAQSNRMPDPQEPNRIVTTTTTTTFSMAKDMAKALCSRFIDARFIECATDKGVTTFKDKLLWQLTPKGICKLGRFVQLNGIVADHVAALLQSGRNTVNILSLERDPDTDAIFRSKSCVEIAFRRFVGKKPNTKSVFDKMDVDAYTGYTDSLAGVKIVETRKSGDQVVRWSFSGRSAINYLMECTSCLDDDEARGLANTFIQTGLMGYVYDTRGRYNNNLESIRDSRSAIYNVTLKGRRVAGWEAGTTSLPADVRRIGSDGSVRSGPAGPSVLSKGASVARGSARGLRAAQSSTPEPITRADRDSGVDSDESKSMGSPQLGGRASSFGGSSIGVQSTVATTVAGGGPRETNTDRLNTILSDPALRSQFREFLSDNFCEENLSFYMAVVEFSKQVRLARQPADVSEALARAYSIYNAYLAAGSPCELNLDHQLRADMSNVMTHGIATSDDNRAQATVMIETLSKVSELYDRAQRQVFRLMATDSVAKFVRTQLYLDVVGEE
ncbi:human AMSH/STAMBP protein ubiquitin specific-protease [Savitreella phatthalungensis]